MKNKYAPIVIFAYNRPVHLKKVVLSLLKNIEAKSSDLFIFCDGSKSENDKFLVDQVREIAHSIIGFKSIEVIERKENFGLANNIVEGVTQIINVHGKVIVLEDDLIVSNYFLKYMNKSLDLYENNKNVISIHGYNYPINIKKSETFFLKGADCWGWATWERGWKLYSGNSLLLYNKISNHKDLFRFNFGDTYDFLEMLKQTAEKKINSWAICWYASAFLNNKYTLYPSRSLVEQIGCDDSGTNMGNVSYLKVDLSSTEIIVKSKKVKEDKNIYQLFRYFFAKNITHVNVVEIDKYYKRKKLLDFINNKFPFFITRIIYFICNRIFKLGI